jgi:hypothetical protein
MRAVSLKRVWAARALAVVVDGIQIVTVPLFFAGIASPLNNALDLVAGVAFVALLGWHIAFLPTFVAELVPFVDIFPTWTAAVFFVTRGRSWRRLSEPGGASAA